MLKQWKNMLMMLKIDYCSQKKKEILNEIVDERLDEIVGLDKKKVNSDDLIYKSNGNTADAKFDKFDVALNIVNKMLK